MGFLFFLLYLAVTTVFPAEIFPELAAFHIPLWLGLVGLVVSVLTLAPSGKLSIRILPIGLVAGLVLSMILSVMWADRWLGAPRHVVEVFGPTLTLFVLAIWNVTSLRRLRVTATVITLLAMILVGQSVAAYHFGFMSDRLLLRENADEDAQDESNSSQNAQVRVRGLGQMNDPNDLALVLVTSLAFLGFSWQTGTSFRNAIFLGVPAAFIIYGVYLTRSRGGLLGVLAVLFVSLAGRISRFNAILVTVVMATIFMGANFTGGREMSTSEESAARRVDAWSEGLDMFRSNPVLGVGFQNFLEHNDLTAHNSFVLCFAELGAVGYFFWLALLIVALLQLNAVRNSKGDGYEVARLRRYALAIRASLVGVLVAAFFLSRSYNPVFYLVVGAASALYTEGRRSGHSCAIPSLYRLGWGITAIEFASIIAMYLLVRVNRLLVH